MGATKNFEPEVVAYRPAFVGDDGVAHGNYTSGGGFSNYFEIPPYQKKAVTNYVKNLKNQYSGLYNKRGRAYPDVSGQGLYFYFRVCIKTSCAGCETQSSQKYILSSKANDFYSR